MSAPETPAPCALPRPRRRWLAAAAAGLVILLCGIAIGAAGTVIIAHDLLVGAIQDPDAMAELVTRRMVRKLDLDGPQEARVREIVTRHAASLAALRASVRPRFDAELDQMVAEIAAALEPAQADAWHAWIARLRATWQPPLEAPPQ
jgi:hypothetical protein